MGMFCFNVDIQTFRYSFHKLARARTFFGAVGWSTLDRFVTYAHVRNISE